MVHLVGCSALRLLACSVMFPQRDLQQNEYFNFDSYTVSYSSNVSELWGSVDHGCSVASECQLYLSNAAKMRDFK